MPQLALSVCVLAQLPAHSIWPGAQTQRLAEQMVPPAQRLLQRPQFCASLVVSTHTGGVPHIIRGAAQPVAHAPATQLEPAPHACPHAPQFIASFTGSTHSPLHAMRPVGQVGPSVIGTSTPPVSVGGVSTETASRPSALFASVDPSGCVEGPLQATAAIESAVT